MSSRSSTPSPSETHYGHVVSNALGRRTMSIVYKDIQLDKKQLWSSKRKRNFVQRMIQATLYKDLTACSYNTLLLEIKSTLPMSKRSLRHNVQLVRSALREWANKVLLPTPLATLERLAKDQIVVESFQKVHIWVDSTEFRLSGKCSLSRKDQNWSYKVNGPGRKWLFLHDARGRVVMVHGPTSRISFCWRCPEKLKFIRGHALLQTIIFTALHK